MPGQELKPILFNTEMVQAIMDGRKIVTRRLVKPQPVGKVHHMTGYKIDYYAEEKQTPDGLFMPEIKRPYQPGDILYVRETWRVKSASYPPRNCEIEYRAGGTSNFDEIIALPTANGEWKPSIHMPKKAARIFLRVKYCRLERLRDMVLADVLMEGVTEGETYKDTWKRWHDLWDSTIPADDLPTYGWEANPWVWVIRFERCEKPQEV